MKGQCKHLDHRENVCYISGQQCIGSDICEQYEEQE